MEKYSGKIIRILLFFGVFAYLQYHDYSRGAFKIGTVTGGLLMASAVYLISSLFGILLNLSGNYLIATLCTGSLALFLAFKLDEFIAKVSWLNENIVATVLIIVSILCIVKDFFILKPKQVTNTTIPDDYIKSGISLYETDPNKAMRDSIKSDSQSVFNLSNGYSCTMKSHFRKFGNQMSGSGNHLCEFTRVMLYLDHIPHAWTFHAQHQCL